MHLLGELFALLAVASLGIFFGAMLTEGLVLVPYWRSLPAEAFYSWYAANDKRLLGFFGPLTWLAALVCAWLRRVISLWTAHPGRWYAVVAAACAARGRLDVLRLLRAGQRRLFGRWYAGQRAPRGVGSLGRLASGPQRPQPGRAHRGHPSCLAVSAERCGSMRRWVIDSTGF